MADTELKVRIVADTSDYDKKVKNLKTTDVIDKSQVSNTRSVSQELANIKNVVNGIRVGNLSQVGMAVARIKTSLDKMKNSGFEGLVKNIRKQFKDVSSVLTDSGSYFKDAFSSLTAQDTTISERFMNFSATLSNGFDAAKKIVKEHGAEIKRIAIDLVKKTVLSIRKFLITALEGLAVGGVITFALTKLTNSIAKTGNEIDKSSQKAGMSSQAYQKWSYILNICGVEVSTLQTAMKQLGRSQAQAANGSKEMAEAYAKLGISQKELKNSKPQEIFEKSVKALQNMSNQADRTAIATSIFGRNSAELNTVLNLSNKETETLSNNFKNLGGSMNSGLVKMSAKLQDSITNLKQAWQGVLNILGEKLIPLLKNAVEWLTQMTVKAQEFMAILFGVSSTVEDANPAGAMTDYTEAVEGAEAETKKLLTLISGFDELNVLPSKDSSDASSSSGLSDEDFDFSSKVEVEESKFDGLSQKWKDFAKWLRENLDSILDIATALITAFAAWKLAKPFLDDLEGLKASLAKVAKVATGLVISIAGYTLEFEGAKEIGRGSASFGDWLKMVVGAALGVGGLAWVSSTLGIGAGMSLLVSLPLTVGILFTGIGLGKEEKRRNQMDDDIKNAIQQATADKEYSIELKARVEAIDAEISDDTKVNIQNTRNLIDQLFELTDKDNKTAGEIQKIKDLCEQINNSGLLDDFKLAYDEATGSINTTKEKLTELIDEQERQLKLAAYKDALTSLYKIQAENELQQEEVATRLTNLYERRNGILKNLQPYYDRKKAIEDEMKLYDMESAEYLTLQSQLLKLNSEYSKELSNLKGVDEAINTERESLTTLQIEQEKTNTKIENFEKHLYNVADTATKTSTAIKDLKTNIEKLPSKKVIEIEQHLSTSGTEVVATVNGQKSAFLDFKKVQAYAKGGVVNTPTVAMVGEYANAKSNPEIITPESKMREVFAESNADLGDTFIQIGQQIISAINNKDTSITIGDETIARSASRGNRAYKQRTGVPLLV